MNSKFKQPDKGFGGKGYTEKGRRWQKHLVFNTSKVIIEFEEMRCPSPVSGICTTSAGITKGSAGPERNLMGTPFRMVGKWILKFLTGIRREKRFRRAEGGSSSSDAFLLGVSRLFCPPHAGRSGWWK